MKYIEIDGELFEELSGRGRQMRRVPHETGRRRCAKCDQVKDIRTCFNVRSDGSADFTCRKCVSERSKLYYRTHFSKAYRKGTLDAARFVAGIACVAIDGTDQF